MLLTKNKKYISEFILALGLDARIVSFLGSNEKMPKPN